MSKILLTKKDGKKAVYPASALPNICLELCGGGMLASQTAKAMLMQSQVLDGVKVKAGIFTIELIEESPCL